MKPGVRGVAERRFRRWGRGSVAPQGVVSPERKPRSERLGKTLRAFNATAHAILPDYTEAEVRERQLTANYVGNVR